MSTTPHMDTMRCKHCDAIVALIPRASIIGRFTLQCLHCGVKLVVWPPRKDMLDAALVIKYTDAVPA